MFKIICVTNRKQCFDFSERIKKISEHGVPIILREKDLNETEYKTLAADMLKVNGDLILHTYASAARDLGVKKIHLPLNVLRTYPNVIHEFETVGASVHSPCEAREARDLGADYVIAGHIFPTDCKKGIRPRGLDFLENVCCGADIPVYAIGGITPDNIASLRQTGAAGACVMSGFMKCPLDEIEDFTKRLRH